MKIILPLIAFILIISGCHRQKKKEYVDHETIYINKANSNLRVVNQSISLSNPEWGATIIPSYQKRTVIKNFETNSIGMFDTFKVDKSLWIPFNVNKSEWGDMVLFYFEKEHMKKLYDNFIKKGNFDFIDSRITNFDESDIELLEKGSKIHRGFYCYSNLTQEKVDFKTYTFINRGTVFISTFTEDNYLLDEIKLCEQLITNDFSFNRTTRFTSPDQFETKKTYINLNNKEEIETITSYKIESNGEINRINNNKYDTLVIK